MSSGTVMVKLQFWAVEGRAEKQGQRQRGQRKEVANSVLHTRILMEYNDKRKGGELQNLSITSCEIGVQIRITSITEVKGGEQLRIRKGSDKES